MKVFLRRRTEGAIDLLHSIAHGVDEILELCLCAPEFNRTVGSFELNHEHWTVDLFNHITLQNHRGRRNGENKLVCQQPASPICTRKEKKGNKLNKLNKVHNSNSELELL
jgi:hypothetical protein